MAPARLSWKTTTHDLIATIQAEKRHVAVVKSIVNL